MYENAWHQSNNVSLRWFEFDFDFYITADTQME